MTHSTTQSRLSNELKLASATGALLLGSGANAAVINITDSFSLTSNQVTQSNSFSGQFNILDLLPTGATLSSHNVVSASLSVLGMSSANIDASSSASAYTLFSSQNRTATVNYRDYYSYRCSWCWSSSSGYRTLYTSRNYQEHQYERDTLERYTDLVKDTMRVSLGSGETASDTVGQSQNSSTTSPRVFDRTGTRFIYNNYTGADLYAYDRYYSNRTTEYDVWSGQLSVQQSLSQLTLDDINVDGMLDIEIAASAGQFSLNQVSLSVEVAEVLRSSSVPAPESLFLYLLATLGLIKRFDSRGRPVKA